ncbi:hypothetical protein P3T23_004525 [Paraburkholderia sp. GAS448]
MANPTHSPKPARPRFTLPADPRPRAGDDENLNGPPPVVPPCGYLREKATGMVHVYSEEMARRGDLVEACDGPDDSRPEVVVAPPPPPPPPRPASARRAADTAAPPRRENGIPHSSVELNLHASDPGTR